MKLIEANIYGFGKWTNESFSFSNRINTISGKNEAGKSTLYEFILFMLFGLSPKKRAQYQPKTGGDIGGQLIIQTDQEGRVVIERSHSRKNGQAVCQLENGELRGEEWLQKHLGGVNRNVFEAVFNFSAEDLTHLHNLKGSEVGEVFLNIGLSGSDRIYQTEKWLEKQLMERFKPKGKKPEINKQIQKLDDMYKQRRKAESEADQYEHLQKQLSQLISNKTEIEKKIRECQHLQVSVEQVIKCLPLLSKYHILKKESGEPVNFPEDGRNRFQQIKEAILPLESEENVRRKTIEKNHQQVNELKNHLAEEHIFHEGEKLLNEKKEYDRYLYEQQQGKQQLASIRQKIERDMGQMNIPIKYEELKEYSLPFYIEETWRNLKESALQLEAEEDHLEEERSQLKADRQSVHQKRNALETDTAQETEVHMADSSDSKSSGFSKALLTGILLLLLGSGWGLAIFNGELMYGLYASVLSVMTTALYFYSGKRERTSSSRTMPDDAAKQRMYRYEEKRREQQRLDDQLNQLNQKDIQVEEKKSLLTQKSRNLESGIQEQEYQYPFLQSVSIKFWDQLYHILKRVQENVEEYERMQAHVQASEETVMAVEERLTRFYAENGTKEEIKVLKEIWEWLDLFVNDQLKIREEITQCGQHVKENEDLLEQITIKLESLYKKRNEMFIQAGVEGEEPFFHKWEAYKTWKDGKAESERLHSQLENMISDEEQEHFQVWKHTPNESMLRTKLRDIISERDEWELHLQETQQEIAEIRTALNQLESSEEQSLFAHQYEAERSSFNELAKEWAAFQIASELLKQTKKNHKEKFMPTIMDKTTDYFNRLTQGTYKAVHLIEKEDHFRVERTDHQLFSVQELSRGTRDQLYISLRLALGVTMSETLPLPFLMDDAFVHFDHERLEEMFTLMEEISKQQQILILTCHDSIKLRFSEFPSISLEQSSII